MKNDSASAAHSANLPIGEKIFDDTDQVLFSKMSGDRNPIHLDALIARRFLTGQRVVYGIHVVLCALEFWLAKNPETIQTIKCIFKYPIYLGEKAVFLQEKNNFESVIRIYVDNQLCVKINLLLSEKNSKSEKNLSLREVLYSGYIPVKVPDAPCNPLPADEVGKKYNMALHDPGAVKDFPHCRSRLGLNTVAAICSLSFFAGMICPGLYSLLSTINISLFPSDGHDDQLFYVIDGFDPRFDLFSISVTGVISGDMTVFKRPAPVQQTSISTLSNDVLPREFINTTSLIIGGSRGLGEYTAKLLVAGGGKVILTYAEGQSDAQRVCDELNIFRGDSCRIQKYNVLEDPPDKLLVEQMDSLTAVYYFATPKIFRRKSAVFSKDIFDDFFSVYVSKFASLCSYLDDVAKSTIKVFLPSSVAVTETLDELAEYAAAKLAAEQLAEKINKTHVHVSVFVSRLPRLDTDQTATLPRTPSSSTLETMLPLLRSINIAVKK